MKYLCTNCSYVYEESFWDEVEWIEAWTKIESFDACPVCDEFDTFHHIEEEIIYIEEDTGDALELLHFIDATKQDWTIQVTIWNNIHPMWKEHRISWVWLFDEYWELLEEEFLWVESDLSIDFYDYDLDDFEIRVKCNEHNLFARKFAL